MPRGVYDRTSHSEDVQPHQGAVVKSTDGVEIAREAEEVEPVVAMMSKSKLDTEAFMNEPVQIIVEKSRNPGDPYESIPVGCNSNRVQWIPRGVPVTVPRRFIGVLARAVISTVNQAWHTNPGTGNVDQVDTTVTYRAYPFSVISDANPRGADWLRNLLMQPV